MKKYGYTEKRQMYAGNLRELCIKHDWYTKGDNKDYHHLLGKANNLENITCDDLVELATDIKSHSDTEYEITSIMYELATICYHTFSEDE